MSIDLSTTTDLLRSREQERFASNSGKGKVSELSAAVSGCACLLAKEPWLSHALSSFLRATIFAYRYRHAFSSDVQVLPLESFIHMVIMAPRDYYPSMSLLAAITFKASGGALSSKGLRIR